MTKRPFTDAFDDLTTDVTSSTIKHAKTVDYEPFINLLSASTQVLSTLTGMDCERIQQEIDGVDNDVIGRVLANVEKKNVDVI